MKAAVSKSLLTIIISLMGMVVMRCGKKDCSSIDLKLLEDVKFEDNIKTHATKLEEFPVELAVHLNRTQKLILRCKSESDFLRDRVLPGLILWISDSWHLRSDTSNLGKIFKDHAIDPWERSRVVGILFHRHENDLPLNIDSLLADAAVRSAWHGRIKSVAAEKNMSSVEKDDLRILMAKNDSLINVSSSAEIMLSRAERLLPQIDSLIKRKNAALAVLENFAWSVQEKTLSKKDLDLMSDKTLQHMLTGFIDLPEGKKFLMIEQAKVDILTEEIDHLSPTSLHQKSNSSPAL